MRIAICVNSYAPSIGGCEVVTAKIANYLAQEHEVRVFSRVNYKRRDKRIGNVIVESYNPINAGSFLLKIKPFKPDIVLVYSDMFDFFNETVQSFENIVLFPCGGNRLFTKPATHAFLRNKKLNIRKVICHTKSERDYDLMVKLGFDPEIIPIGVDLEEFDKNSLERKDIIQEEVNPYWILNVSNFFPGKGQQFILDILPQIENRQLTYIQVCSTMSFAIGSQLETEWRMKADALSRKHKINVVLVKDKEREKIVGLFKNSNVFVFPSQKESAGLVLLESMAAALPWVSTNVGIATDIKGGHFVYAAKDGKYNSIVDDRVKGSFARRIEECLKNPQMGDEGRKFAEENYQWNSLLPQYSNSIL